MTPATPHSPPRYDTLPTVSSKGTDLQSFRLPAQLWKRFSDVAKERGTNRSEVLRSFIRWYVGDPDAKLPERPEPS